MKAKLTTAIDKALSFETVYYSAPVPRDAATLTILGAVFDKVYFPGVHLPKGGYDQGELDKEIARIEGLGGDPGRDGDVMLGMLRFTKHAKTLEGFCEFTSGGYAFGTDEQIPQEALEEFYFGIHGRNDPNWHPMFEAGYHKGMPGSDAYIAYPGLYHYFFHAVADAQRRGISLLNDRPGAIPMAPAVDQSSPHTDAKMLSTILAIECAKLALPEMPMLSPQELMEFRSENVDALRAYRRAMLQYAGELAGSLKDLPPADIEKQTQFFVQTEIVPVLDALRGSINNPARPWYARVADGAVLLAEFGVGLVTLGASSAIAVALGKTAGILSKEVMAKGDHRTAMRRSGLYYLLQLERAHQQK